MVDLGVPPALSHPRCLRGRSLDGLLRLRLAVCETPTCYVVRTVVNTKDCNAVSDADGARHALYDIKEWSNCAAALIPKESRLYLYKRT